ncbi:MAG TPA: NADH-quinone oxidoreductase subunit N [Myxococcales bacterium]|nr:NADH-quinone oxidoreductase subunit N [Myxococcales bacterium]
MGTVLDNAHSAFYFLPEIVLTAGAMLVFVLDLTVAKSPRRMAILSWVSIAILGVATWATWYTAHAPYAAAEGGAFTPLERPVALFHGLIVVDAWAIFFKYLSWIVTALCIWIAEPSLEIGSDRIGEYCALLLSIGVGMSLMASATDMLMMAIGVELVSMVSYALAGFRKHHRKSSEAALKYVVYGGVASGMMLFGMSWLYGLLGSTNIVQAGPQVQRYGERLFLMTLEAGQAGAGQLALVMALVLVLAGVGYKIASVPWHMWCPDVYEGAPTPFTAFLSVGPKAAGFALAVRIFFGALSSNGASPDMATVLSDVPWPQVIGVIAALTMTVGNFAAMSQTNLKRMLAYSSIAHAGSLLMGLAAASKTGSQSIAIYLVVYLFMNLGAFLVVGAVARLSGSESLFEYRGLSSRAPFAAITFAIFLFSLTGLPPLAGFVGKFQLFKALVDRGQPWHIVLAIIGVLNSAVSLYYYARIVKAMFLDKSQVEERIPIPTSYHVLMGALAAAVIVFGVYFDGLLRMARSSLDFFGHT